MKEKKKRPNKISNQSSSLQRLRATPALLFLRKPITPDSRVTTNESPATSQPTTRAISFLACFPPAKEISPTPGPTCQRLGAHPATRRRRTRLFLRGWAPAPPLRPRLGLGAAACVLRNSDRRGHVARFAAAASGGGDEAGEPSEDEAQREWEAELNRRLKEAEEMEELERTAEQLQSQAAAEATEESEEEKRERVRRELQKVAQEQAERRATAKQMFELGQKAYGRGMYGRSIEFLEAALTIIRPSSLLGGEIQIWLAMAYEANRRHKDCIALYKELESSHPMINIRRQAAELRYILEALKLKISNDEVVSIPQIGSSWDWYAGTWSDKIKEQEDKKRKMIAASNQAQPSPNIFGDFSFLRRPNEWKKSAWGIATLWVLLIGTAIYLQT